MDPRHKMHGPKREEMTPKCMWEGCQEYSDRDYAAWAWPELKVYCVKHREVILDVLHSTRKNGRHRLTLPQYG